MNYNEINNMIPTSRNTPSNNSGYVKATLAIIILLVLAIFIYDNVSKNNADPIVDSENTQMQIEENQNGGENIDAEIDAVLESNFDADMQSIESEF